MNKQKVIVAIHQPNFFPWLGYFDKMMRADVFVFLDHVQFPKSGGTWLNRVKLIQGKAASWITIPIVRSFHGVRCINEIEINNALPWREKIFRTLQTNYGRAPFFKEVFPFIEELVNTHADLLSDYNIATISALASSLGIDLSKCFQSSGIAVDGASNELLINIVKAVNGTTYMCGGGADGYQVDEVFAESGVELLYQDFKHPVYPQFNTREFVPGLSIIDVLMNCGYEGTKTLMDTGKI